MKKINNLAMKKARKPKKYVCTRCIHGDGSKWDYYNHKSCPMNCAFVTTEINIERNKFNKKFNKKEKGERDLTNMLIEEGWL